MEEYSSADPIPVRSESTDFELQAHAVAKETAEIREALVESSETEISVSASDVLTSEKMLDLDTATIPVLIDFKPLSGGLPEGDQIQIEVPVEGSAENNNNENEKNIGEDQQKREIISEDQITDPVSSASEDQATDNFITLDGIILQLEEKLLISNEPEVENIVDNVPLTEGMVQENVLIIDEDSGISESTTEIGGCCVFISVPTPTNTIAGNETKLSISPKSSIPDCVEVDRKENMVESVKSEELQANTNDTIEDDDTTTNKTESDTLIAYGDEQHQIVGPVIGIGSQTALSINVPPSLRDYECFFNWDVYIKDEPLTEEEAITIEKVIYDKFADTVTEAEEKARLKYSGIETISYKATQAFCNIVLKKTAEARIQISEAMDLVNKYAVNTGENVAKDYADGMHYVIRGLHMFLLSQQLEDAKAEAEAKEQLELLIPTSEPFNCLSVKAKVGVLAMKHFFFAQRRHTGSKQTQILILDQIISMDESHEWYYQLYNVLRICRRELQFRSEPDEREKSLILKAVELAPEHPLVNLGLCQCLLEIFRNRNTGSNGSISSSWKDKIEMGTVGTFKSTPEMVDFIKDRTKKVLAIHGDSVKVNVHVAEFFTVLLPYPFRDNKIAKQCISRALAVAPNSSRANHRMGIFCLTSETNPKEALKYFDRAVETDPRNFPALSDVIQTCLGDPLGNGERLKKILKDHLENPIWQDSKLATLYFFYGIFQYMKRENSAAVDNWIKAYQTNPESVKSFKSINYFCGRYRWNRKDISIMGIQTTLKKALEERSKNSEKEVIEKILEIVAGVISETAERNSMNDANRRGRGGRGSNSHQAGQASRPGTGTGIFSSRSNYSAPTSDSQPNNNGYRGVGRGTARGTIRGSSRGNTTTVASSGERSHNNAVIREPRPPEEGRGFAPRGAGPRGNPVGRTVAGTTQPTKNK